jgi:hypothetical protein
MVWVAQAGVATVAIVAAKDALPVWQSKAVVINGEGCGDYNRITPVRKKYRR